MQALFIGQTYIDVTFLADHMPHGDEKSVASEYAVSFGGNAVTAAFCCAKLGIKPDLIATVADDWLGNMFLDMAAKYDVHLHRPQGREILAVLHHAEERQARHRALPRRPLSARRFPALDLDGCRALHLDGHQADAALFYAQALPQGRHSHLARRRRPAHQHPRTAGLHRRRDGGRAVLRADGQDAGGDARLSQEPRLQDRRRDAGRARRALVRRERRRCERCRRCRCRRPRARHQRRRRRVPRRLCVFLSRQPVQRLGASISGLPSTPRPTRSSISATKRACRRSTRSTRSRASSIRVPAIEPRPARERSRRCAQPLIGREFLQRTGHRRRQFGYSLTVPGTLIWSFSPSTSSIPIETSRRRRRREKGDDLLEGQSCGTGRRRRAPPQSVTRERCRSSSVSPGSTPMARLVVRSCPLIQPAKVGRSWVLNVAIARSRDIRRAAGTSRRHCARTASTR